MSRYPDFPLLLTGIPAFPFAGVLVPDFLSRFYFSKYFHYYCCKVRDMVEFFCDNLVEYIRKKFMSEKIRTFIMYRENRVTFSEVGPKMSDLSVFRLTFLFAKKKRFVC